MDIGDIVGGAASAFGLGDSVEGLESLVGAAAPLAELAGAIAPGLAFICPPAAVACGTFATAVQAAEAMGLGPDQAEAQKAEPQSAQRNVREAREEAVRDNRERPVSDHRTDPRDHRTDRRDVRDHRSERPEHTVRVRSGDRYEGLTGLLKLAAVLGDKVDAAERRVEDAADKIGEGEGTTGDSLEAQALAEQLRIVSTVATQAIAATAEAFKAPAQR